MATKKYIVTGGAGFIGSHVAEALLQDGHQVLIVDDLSTGKRENIPAGAEFDQLDVATNREVFAELCAGVDGIFHLAAIAALQRSIEDPLTTNRNNIVGTLNVLLAARDAGVRRVVFTSSCAVYASDSTIVKDESMPTAPESPYALEKLTGEHYMRLFSSLYGLETVALRYFNVYGPRMAATGGYASVMRAFLDNFSIGTPLSITGDGEQTRDFVHVTDVARANLEAMQSPKVGKGEVLNVGSSVATSINRLAEIIGGKALHIPARPGEIRFISANIDKAYEFLDWAPQVKLEDGVASLK